MDSEAKGGLAVVVGGARGIGAAVARALAAQEWVARIAVADLLADDARAVAQELSDAGARAEGHHVDLADPASVEQLVSATADAAHVCVSAGIFAAEPSLETTRETFERVLAVNVVGTYHVVQSYARGMVSRTDGAIVAIASVAARQPRMLQAAYCASKAGMRQALRVLALETAPSGVRINFVSPGPTDTEMARTMAKDHAALQRLADGRLEAFRPRIVDGRLATPEDIASAAAFLLSPAARHVHLHDLVVDGGELLGV